MELGVLFLLPVVVPLLLITAGGILYGKRIEREIEADRRAGGVPADRRR